MGKIIAIIAVLSLSSIAVCGDIYIWTDAKGVKRFSNTPVTSVTDTKKVKSIGHEIIHTAPTAVESVETGRGTTSREVEGQGTRQIWEKTLPETQPYKIEWSPPIVSGDSLSIHGSISDGAPCPKLNVMVFLYDEKGNEKFIRCHAAGVGGTGSGMLDGKIKLKSSDYGSDWRVSSHSAKCSRK